MGVVMNAEEESELLAIELEQSRPGPGPLTRLWRRVFGQLVYDGPETCGHCKFWKRPNPEFKKGKFIGYGKYEQIPFRGDCKLLYGKEDTLSTDCDRFTPRRRYHRRLRDEA